MEDARLIDQVVRRICGSFSETLILPVLGFLFSRIHIPASRLVVVVGDLRCTDHALRLTNDERPIDSGRTRTQSFRFEKPQTQKYLTFKDDLLVTIKLKTKLKKLELSGNDHRFHSMSALEILRETVRILWYNSWGFLAIALLLICPVSALLLSNLVVDQSLVKRLTIRMFLIAKSSVLPLRDFISHSCQKFAEMAISCTMCFPLYITLSLLSKAAVVYSMYCSYSPKKFDASQFYLVICKIWRRVVSTYVWMFMVVAGCVVLFLVLLLVVCNACSIVGLSPNYIVYAAMVVALPFSVGRDSKKRLRVLGSNEGHDTGPSTMAF
ncbi:unnamed protein product [Malus baccata var. baccata]